MSIDKTEAFYIGNAFGVGIADCSNAWEVKEILEMDSYPAGVQRRAGEIMCDGDLVGAICDARRIILEVINEHE